MERRHTRMFSEVERLGVRGVNSNYRRYGSKTTLSLLYGGCLGGNTSSGRGVVKDPYLSKVGVFLSY